jgi:hypothetical protein
MNGVTTMNEAEWFDCTDPHEMLEFVRDKVCHRKLRLFACACCRRIWHLLTDQRSRKAVEVAERYADGYATAEELAAVAQDAYAAAQKDRLDPRARGHALIIPGLQGSGTYIAADAAAFAADDVAITIDYCYPPAEAAAFAVLINNPTEHVVQAALLRDLLGPIPFRPLPSLNPSWLRFHQGITIELAGTIYQDRVFDHLPILADALEEAGCTNADILNHCRQAGEHIRGCWIVDLILGAFFKTS